jgi:predicted DNA-binding ribbon-helix-helix protein
VKVERITIEPITAEGHDATLKPGRVRINGRRTTLHLESALWKLLCDIAHEQNLSLDELCTDIAEVTAPGASFADAARCYVLGHCAEDIPDEHWPEELRTLRELGYPRSIQ